MRACELKILADKANQDKESPQIESGYQRLKLDLKEIAALGKYSAKFFLEYLNVNEKVWEGIAQKLREDGFKVTFDSEIGAMYSNTDYDTEYFVEISWL